jgi:hypothetical protein
MGTCVNSLTAKGPDSDRAERTSCSVGGTDKRWNAGSASTELEAAPIHAVRHIRRMRGGSQSQLLRCSDGHYYVVKFPHNPQGSNVLACDFLGTLLATRLGLPTQQPCVIEVSSALIDDSPAMVIEHPRGTIPLSPGKCFGSRYPVVSRRGAFRAVSVVVDFWYVSDAQTISNIADCAGILIFDQWTCNTDARQLILSRRGKSKTWYVSMIDQGSCFNGRRWNFPDSPLWGLHHGLQPYIDAKRFADFEPWLDRLERKIDLQVIESAARQIPAEWYGSDREALNTLIHQLDRRRTRTRDLIWGIIKVVPKNSMRAPSHQFTRRCKVASNVVEVVAFRKPELNANAKAIPPPARAKKAGAGSS